MIALLALYSALRRESGQSQLTGPDQYSIGRASIGLVCEEDEFSNPRRHGRATPPASIDAGWHRRLCSAAQVLPDGDLPGVPAQPFNLDVQPAPLDIFPGLVDSNSPAYWRGETLNLLNSAWAETYRSQGEGVLALSTPAPVTLPRPSRPGNVWIEAVWQDTETRVLYGWYHFEPADLDCGNGLTAPLIGAAISRDGGATWEDQGIVLENSYPVDCGWLNGFFAGGNGDFSVILGPEGKYFYFLFSNYKGPIEQQGVGIARSAVADRGQPGTVQKYYQGGWNEPGLGGKVTAIFRTPTGWPGPNVDAPWGPSVHWNHYLNSYVVLLNRTLGPLWEQEGIYISFSKDLINWTRPVKILETNEYYPQILGLGPEGTDRWGGQVVRLYVGGISEYIIAFNLEEEATAPSQIPSLIVPPGLREQETALSRPPPQGLAASQETIAAATDPEAAAVDGSNQADAPDLEPVPPGDEGAPLLVGEDIEHAEPGPPEGIPDI